MESLSHTSLFSWLTNGETASYQNHGQTLSRHVESQAPEGTTSLRLIYESPVSEAEIARAISVSALPLSLALIDRQSGLNCIELCSNEPFDFTHLQLFSSIESVEAFSIAPEQPVLNRPGILVMDMDSTAIEIECIDELAAMAGVGEAVAEVTERAMQGELDFEESLRGRVSQLTGADESIIQTLCDKLPLMPGITEMVRELQSHNWRVVVASGGFTPFVGHLKALLNLDAAYANKLDIEEGKLVGTVSGTVVDAQFKADTVDRCAQLWNIPRGQRLAIGDGANDIPMIQAADYGIAYHAKPKLKRSADVAISQLDLRALPYLLRLV
ncbi:phosphoserine phosphatase SerB [Shewanella atlantica]|uniref:phosphoserine phosphatase SerB n=1 Tax=Shewanella atlantica TaxID=271099 RepID=UPI0037369751